MGRALAMAFLGFGLMTFISCNQNSSNADNGNDSASTTPKEVKLDGNTLTYGDHVYTVNGDIDFETTVYNAPSASVTFTNIPSDYNEFEAVYNNLLGKSPQGAAAMLPMAFELYARDNTAGQNALNLLCNGSTTVDGIVRILKTKFEVSEHSPADDPYVQRYMAAALLKGADNKNAYAPEEPYTVEMCASPNGVKDAPLSGGTVYYLYILANGWDTFQRSVEIMQSYNSEYYKVFNCPATYAQCKPIAGTWTGLK